MAFVRKSDSHSGVSGEVSRTGECVSSLGANGVHQQTFATCTPAELQGRTPAELRHARTPAELRAGVHRLGGFAAPMEMAIFERSVDVPHSLAVMGNTRTVMLPLLNLCGAPQGGASSEPPVGDLRGTPVDLPRPSDQDKFQSPETGTVTAMSWPMSNRYERYDQLSIPSYTGQGKTLVPRRHSCSSGEISDRFFLLAECEPSPAYGHASGQGETLAA